LNKIQFQIVNFVRSGTFAAKNQHIMKQNSFRKHFPLFVVFNILGLILTGCYYDNEEELYSGTVCDTAAPSYLTTIKPIISDNCLSCHSGATPTAGLSLETHDLLVSAIQNKQLMDHVMQLNGYSLMPPSGQLSNCRIEQLNAWVSNGMPNN